MVEIKNSSLRRLLRILIPALLIPLAVAASALLLEGRQYLFCSFLVASLAVLLFIAGFERKEIGTRRMVLVSVMIALSVVGRLIFMPLPGFKPISALVIITGIAFGPVAGFVTGSMSAVVSNMFFGQGPWTPFQMLAWGLIGFLAGVAFRRGKKPHPLALIVAGLLGGVLY
jgi:energy-coupling factor transport system substrate-specific component